MSRTFHKLRAKKRGTGKEHWKSRLKRHGDGLGRYIKRLTHRKERRQDKKLVHRVEYYDPTTKRATLQGHSADMIIIDEHPNAQTRDELNFITALGRQGVVAGDIDRYMKGVDEFSGALGITKYAVRNALLALLEMKNEDEKQEVVPLNTDKQGDIYDEIEFHGMRP